MTRGLVEDEQDGEPVLMRDEEQYSEDHLTDGEWKQHILFEEPIGSMLTAEVRVFSDSVVCTSFCALNPISASNFLELNQKQS